MTSRLYPLLLWSVAFLLASASQAQVVRPSQSIYVLLRGGVTGYYGDLDGNPDSKSLTDGFSDAGYFVGGEVGYHFNENLSFGIGVNYNDVPDLDTAGRGRNGSDVITFPNGTGGRIGTTRNNGSNVFTVNGLFRYLPFDAARISPFVDLGGALVFGVGSKAEQADCLGLTGQAFQDCNSRVIGYGPMVGLGLDIALTPRVGLFLAGHSTFVFPDAGLDGADLGAFVDAGRVDNRFAGADDTDFDILANVGGGLRFALRPPVTAARILGLECPADLEVGENGSFIAITNQNATRPVSSTWQFGDGASGTGTSTSHAFTAPGTYTVTSMVSNAGGTDSETCMVRVTPRPTPPSLAGCRATPSRVDAGQQVTINATASDADDISIAFGDGTTASSLPARHAYANTGSYTVTITATNAYGTDTCTIPVTVGDSYCADITELNPVFYGYGATTLTADATSRLDENIEILRRCPDICVTINGYSDGREPGDAMRISQARADAAMQYYVGQGIDASRLRAVGRGVDPDANSKEDPGPGDSRARRADSIPSSCAGF